MTTVHIVTPKVSTTATKKNSKKGVKKAARQVAAANTEWLDYDGNPDLTEDEVVIDRTPEPEPVAYAVSAEEIVAAATADTRPVVAAKAPSWDVFDTFKAPQAPASSEAIPEATGSDPVGAAEPQVAGAPRKERSELTKILGRFRGVRFGVYKVAFSASMSHKATMRDASTLDSSSGYCAMVYAVPSTKFEPRYIHVQVVKLPVVLLTEVVAKLAGFLAESGLACAVHFATDTTAYVTLQGGA